MSDQQPSFDDDRRDERLREMERRMEHLEKRLGGIITMAGTAVRELHFEREALRAMLGMPPAGPLAPLYERAGASESSS